MVQSALISITGTQQLEGEESESIQLVTEGSYCYEPGYIRFSYVETQMTGLEGVVTTFTIEEEKKVTLQRVGKVNSEMVFELGRRHLSMYDTPYGALAMGVNTRELSAALDEQGGQIRIVYDIELDHSLAGRNTFDIQIRQARR